MTSRQSETSGTDTNGQSRASTAVAFMPGDLENRVLRQAVQENRVSFPSQVPVFEKQSRPDLQQRIVLLYFVRGWTMDDIAKRYGLGRQRMGQILTAWRIRAVKGGYIQAIEPEHPLLQRVRLERPAQFADGLVHRDPVLVRPVTAAPLSADHVEMDDARPASQDTGEVPGSNLAEQLHVIVGVLDNQLQLRSARFDGSIDSCGQLLSRARAICTLLESEVAHAGRNDRSRTTALISAAKELFERFQEHTTRAARSGVLGKPRKNESMRQPRAQADNRNLRTRASQRAAVGV
jgi:hypothetical protein